MARVTGGALRYGRNVRLTSLHCSQWCVRLFSAWCADAIQLYPQTQAYRDGKAYQIASAFRWMKDDWFSPLLDLLGSAQHIKVKLRTEETLKDSVLRSAYALTLRVCRQR
jgi:hypothetical protein